MIEKVRELIVVSILIIFGIYIIGELITGFFGVPNAGKYLFWSIGGIGFFATVFRTKLRDILFNSGKRRKK